jgi:dTDP-glucose 4,6-dehydratase
MILVTGGAGFIGANFVLDWLVQTREPLVNVDKLTYAGNRDSLTVLAQDPRHVFVEGDIADRVLMAEQLRRHRPRAVLHFAAETHVDRSIVGPEAFIESNIVGTFGLLEAVRAYLDSLDAPAREAFRFLHVSTDEVFGSLAPHEAAFTEAHRYAPNSPYAASKAASDHLVRAWHRTYGVPVLTTHCSNNYGPYQLQDKLIPLCIVNALAGKPLPLFGDGLQVRDWLHVQDHCRALRRVLEAGRVGDTYAIGGRSERANIEVVRAVCAILDALRPWPDARAYADQIVHVADRRGHDRRYAIDPAKLTRELGWRPGRTFEDGLRATVQWYLDHPGWLRGAQPTAAPAPPTALTP